MSDSSRALDNMCWFCRNREESELVPVETVATKINASLSIEINKSYDSSSKICQSCIFSINHMYEKRLRMRTSFYNTKANKCYIEGDRIMVTQCLNQKTNESHPTHNPTQNAYTAAILESPPIRNYLNNTNGGIRITAVQSQITDFAPHDEDVEPNAREENENGCVSIISEDEHSTILLKPLPSHCIDRVAKDKCKPTTILKCPECRKEYKTERFMAKHMAKHRRKRSVASLTITRRNAVYKCEICQTIFESRAKLKVHSTNHLQFFECATCKERFLLKFEYEFHCAICEAKAFVAAEQVEPDKVSMSHSRRKTRSQTRSMIAESTTTKVVTDDDCEDGESTTLGTDVDSTYTIREQLMNRYFDEQCQQLGVVENIETETVVEANDNVYNDDDDRLTQISGFTSVSRRPKHNTVANLLPVITKSKTDNQMYCYNTNSHIILPLRYIAEFECSLGECLQKFKTLPEIMQHEINVHCVMPLYICYECDCKFTHPYYLGLHEFSHNKHLFCNICYCQFMTRQQLKLHGIEHLRNYQKCHHCNRTFFEGTRYANHECRTNYNFIRFTYKPEYHRAVRARYIAELNRNMYRTNRTVYMIQETFPVSLIDYDDRLTLPLYNGRFEVNQKKERKQMNSQWRKKNDYLTDIFRRKAKEKEQRRARFAQQRKTFRITYKGISNGQKSTNMLDAQPVGIFSGDIIADNDHFSDCDDDDESDDDRMLISSKYIAIIDPIKPYSQFFDVSDADDNNDDDDEFIDDFIN